MAKRQDEDQADLVDLIDPTDPTDPTDLASEPAAVQPAPGLVQVRALVPMWGGNDQVVPVGVIYRLPTEAATYLANLGMVAIEEAG
jgi:hypothetical protein